MLTNYLTLSAVLFAIGLVGFVSRRNMIVMFLSVELMLQAVSLNLVAFGHAWGSWHGPIFALFVIAVAAAEAGVALALIVALYRSRGVLDSSLWCELREPGLPVPDEVRAAEEAAVQPEPQPQWPKLYQPGRVPEGAEEGEELEEATHV